MDPRF